MTRDQKFDEIAKELKLKELKPLLDLIYGHHLRETTTWQETALTVKLLKDTFTITNQRHEIN